MENFKEKKIAHDEKMIDVYNKYGIISEGVFLEENKVILSEELQNEGWKVGLTFRDTDDHVSQVQEKINLGKNFNEFKIGIIHDLPFSHIRCLLFREKVKQKNYD